MATLIILYGHPDDPAAFEDYYAHQHLPYAGEHMPYIRGADNQRILGTPDGSTAPFYRLSVLSYDSPDELQAAITSEGGRRVLADLDNFATGGVTLLLGEQQ